MPSSTDAIFETLAFPSVDGAGTSGVRDQESLQRAIEQAMVRGHAAGYAAGLREASVVAAERLANLEAEHAEQARLAAATVDAECATLAVAAAAVQRTVIPVLEQSDDAVLAAALELAEAVIGSELSDASAGASAALRRVLGTLGSDAELPGVILRMHPDDAEMLRAAGQLPQALSVQSDPGLGRGDAVAQLPDGLVDARIGTAVLRARRALGGHGIDGQGQ
ncbi:flagellar assembly protein FliH [Microterricola gilva]|uniref:Flagellar assembly protein FliH n=1 Tax=Microterricola gilva TaxID=393267 RepID=A0A4Q8ANL0_9MICO|nr:FliH/SctL family protein [Microterricola gilva]RZU65539.1 flagellar assembly protein FliH [Microterricola gilva]